MFGWEYKIVLYPNDKEIQEITTAANYEYLERINGDLAQDQAVLDLIAEKINSVCNDGDWELNDWRWVDNEKDGAILTFRRWNEL